MLPVVLLVVAMLLILGIYLGQSNILDAWESFKISQSRTLPYISGTFVGRETELNHVLQLLDFDQSDTRVVSIDGPPGFGKSTLAIKVGHRMVHKGINVLYVDMLKVFSMQVLAEKVCKGAGIVIRKVVRIERIFHWARDLSYNTLLILDNCDDILQKHKDDFQRVIQMVVERSPIIKVLMTSRHKVTLLDDSYRYTLHELSYHSACQLLEATIKGIKLDFNTRGVIANLTGNVPLALRIIGSLLNQPVPPSPETIIKELMQKPIQALSPKALPEHHQVYTTINLSYKYLHQYDKLCGQLLAYFPGPFDRIAALDIMQMPPNEVQSFPTNYVHSALCLSELVQRSLLGHNQRTGHFEFHRLIKEFFLFRSCFEENCDGMQHAFNVNFQSHFAYRLLDLAHQFSQNHRSALGALDTEKHNIKYFLEGIMNHLEPNNSFKVISALLAGLDEKLLECRFSVEELHNVTISAANFLRDHSEQIDLDASTHFVLYFKLVHYWAVSESELHQNISSALEILTSHEEHIKRLHTKADKNLVAAQYIAYYSSLSLYYENLGLHHQVPRCQEKILETTNSLKECQPGSCKYFDIGVSYLRAGDNYQGVKYLELALQHPQVGDELQRAHHLTWLHDGYTRMGATAKVEQVVDELIALLPAVLQHDVTMQNKDYFENLIRFYLNIGKSQEAGILQEKTLQLLIELHKTRDQRTVLYARKLTLFLYSIKNYSKAAEIGHLTIELLKRSGSEKHLVTAEMLVLVGKSKLFEWNISGLMSYTNAAINLIQEGEHTSSGAQNLLAQACMFRMWQMDINCIWIVSHLLLKSVDLEELLSNTERASPPRSTSKELAVYSHNMFSVDFLSQMLPIPNFLNVVQHILSQLIDTVPYIATVLFYIAVKFVVVPIILIILTCWPCLACGCMVCISVAQCCCCHCYMKCLCFCNWVGKCMVLLPIILAIYYPIVLLVYYIIFFLLSFCLYSCIVCLTIRRPIVQEYLFVCLCYHIDDDD